MSGEQSKYPEGTWIADFLERDELSHKPITRFCPNGVHFKTGANESTAVLLNRPAFFLDESRQWTPFPEVLVNAGGGICLPGSPIQLGMRGEVAIVGTRHQHFTRAAGDFVDGSVVPLFDFDKIGTIVGREYVRTSGQAELRQVVTQSQVKENLVLQNAPELAGDCFVVETLLPMGNFPITADLVDHLDDGVFFPIAKAYDAAGQWIDLTREVRQVGGLWTMLTFVPAEWLAQAAYPVTIDPSANFGGDTADTNITGIGPSYGTARATSNSYDAPGISYFVGQGYEAPIPRYYVHRAMLKINTTSLPSSWQVLKYNLVLTAVSDASVLADFDVQIVKQDWSASDPIGNGNRETVFDGCLAASFDAVWRNTAGLAVNSPLISADMDVSRVAKGGYTYHGLRSSRDALNVPPPSNGVEYVTIASAEHSTPAYRPYAIVVSRQSAAGGPIFF